MKKKSLTLAISHSLFLTEKQRYDLFSGKSLRVIGASLPVWFHKGKTSEPAEEVFCKYTLNNKVGEASITKTKNNTYIINLPQVPENYRRPYLSDDDWRKMTNEQKNKWYEANPFPLSAKKLLNITDGGCGELNFKLQQEIEFRQKRVDIIHLILIKDVKELDASLIDP